MHVCIASGVVHVNTVRTQEPEINDYFIYSTVYLSCIIMKATYISHSSLLPAESSVSF